MATIDQHNPYFRFCNRQGHDDIQTGRIGGDLLFFHLEAVIAKISKQLNRNLHSTSLNTASTAAGQGVKNPGVIAL